MKVPRNARTDSSFYSTSFSFSLYYSGHGCYFENQLQLENHLKLFKLKAMEPPDRLIAMG